MIDFLTNDQKLNLAKQKFLNLTGNIDGSITREQSNKILKELFTTTSVTEINRLLYDEDTNHKILMIGKKKILASFSRSTTRDVVFSHHHIQIKKRRWRAKKKDQHHRTQNASHQYSSGINKNFMFFVLKTETALIECEIKSFFFFFSRFFDEQEMSDRWEEYGKLILALTKAGTTIDYQMAKQIAEECRVPLKQ
ncbi:unnamed protein product [Rotaria magnacalcarata]